MADAAARREQRRRKIQQNAEARMERLLGKKPIEGEWFKVKDYETTTVPTYQQQLLQSSRCNDRHLQYTQIGMTN